jgi:DNA-binding transcriptional ArsR family regulator
MAVKLSVSFSEELAVVIDELARRRGDERSPLIETLLRENPVVQEGVAAWRKGLWEPPAGESDGGEGGAESRKRVLAQVLADPGLSVAELAARANLTWRSTAYHVRLLQRAKAVEVEQGGRTRRVFPAGLPVKHRQWLSALRIGEASEVLRLLIAEPNQTIPGLSRRLGYSDKVVRRQVANLAEAGLLERRGSLRPVYDLNPVAAPEISSWLHLRRDRTNLKEVPRDAVPP